MYVSGFVVAVPADKKDEYRKIAEAFWEIVKDYGALSQVEAWEADVADGEVTDFRRAVDLAEDEKVVFSWITWPDKATADAGNASLMEDERMEAMGSEMPFDGKRMIVGGFEAMVARHAG